MKEGQTPGSVEGPRDPVFAELPCATGAASKDADRDVVATVRMGAVSLDIYPGANAEILTALFEGMRHVE